MSDYDGRKMFARIGSAPLRRVYREALKCVEYEMRRVALLEAKLADVRIHAVRWSGGTSNEAIFGDIILGVLDGR